MVESWQQARVCIQASGHSQLCFRQYTVSCGLISDKHQQTFICQTSNLFVKQNVISSYHLLALPLTPQKRNCFRQCIVQFFSLSVELNCITAQPSISFSNAVVMLLTLKHSSSSITNQQLITRYVQTGIINVNINNN